MQTCTTRATRFLGQSPISPASVWTLKCGCRRVQPVPPWSVPPAQLNQLVNRRRRPAGRHASCVQIQLSLAHRAFRPDALKIAVQERHGSHVAVPMPNLAGPIFLEFPAVAVVNS